MLEKSLQNLTQACTGTAAYYVKELAAAEVFAHNAHTRMPAASLIKLPILWEYYRQVQAGQLDPQESLTVPGAEVVGGCGIIKDLAPGAALRYKDLARLMIVLSDNTATNLLIEKLGLANISTTIQQLGMAHTVLQRKLMDYAARDRGLDNFTCAHDVALILEKIARHEGLPPGACQEMLDILQRQQLRNKLPALLPEGTWLAHKTGDQTTNEHDAGIMRLGTKTAVVVAMTQQLPQNAAGVAFCQQVGLAVYNWLAR